MVCRKLVYPLAMIIGSCRHSVTADILRCIMAKIGIFTQTVKIGLEVTVFYVQYWSPRIDFWDKEKERTVNSPVWRMHAPCLVNKQEVGLLLPLMSECRFKTPR